MMNQNSSSLYTSRGFLLSLVSVVLLPVIAVVASLLNDTGVRMTGDELWIMLITGGASLLLNIGGFKVQDITAVRNHVNELLERGISLNLKHWTDLFSDRKVIAGYVAPFVVAIVPVVTTVLNEYGVGITSDMVVAIMITVGGFLVANLGVFHVEDWYAFAQELQRQWNLANIIAIEGVVTELKPIVADPDAKG